MAKALSPLAEEIQARIIAPLKKENLRHIKIYEGRLRMHTEPFTDIFGSRAILRPITDFDDWVRMLLPHDKYQVFKTLFKLPIPTTSFVATLFNELERVFDGKNPAFSYNFSKPEYQLDWEAYRQTKLLEPDVWQQRGWDAVKTMINSILIIDIPWDTPTEPFFFWLSIDNVIDFETDDTSTQMKRIIYRVDNKFVAALDQDFWYLFEMEDKDPQQIKEVIREQPHGLPYCPARFYWTTPLTASTPEVKKSPIASQLGNLDWLLFFEISKRHLDMYAPYPIYSTYEMECDYRNEATGEYCDGGFLRSPQGQMVYLETGMPLQCPICSPRRFTGVGSIVEIPKPLQGEPDLKNPVQITAVDAASLEYNVKELDRLKTLIYKEIVGRHGEAADISAVNEMQIASDFENRTSILNSLKVNLENAQKFVDDTCCVLRYRDAYLGSNVSLGTAFYIYSVEDLQKQYNMAKKNGFSQAMLGNLTNQIISTEFRDDPHQLERMTLLRHLEPMSGHTVEEASMLASRGLATREDAIVKANFLEYVDRFERENTSLAHFGKDIEFAKRVEAIKEEMKKYAKEVPKIKEYNNNGNNNSNDNNNRNNNNNQNNNEMKAKQKPNNSNKNKTNASKFANGSKSKSNNKSASGAKKKVNK